MMFMLVITGAIGFMFATSQPMTGIEIIAIHNVVTSDQVLMFDLTVKAHNPNIVVVTIDHANLEGPIQIGGLGHSLTAQMIFE
ncbi:unnamed protein product [Fusarium graminearum]|nr:unnamed protein product [Fusarium graminearum]